jgi:predicted transposase YbfD/YdcC
MSLSFLAHFSVLADHRISGLVTYPLDEILLSTLTGLVCGAQDWEDVAIMAVEHLAWLRGFLPFADGVATAQTYRVVFRALDSDVLAKCFVSWASSLAGHIKGVVAIDGKTSRGSKQDASGFGALHLLSAFAREAGLVIGQRKVNGKSNEITAIPELLEVLALEGAIVTIDAMGAQKAVAAAIVAKEADYLLALKGNQGALHEDVRLFFAEKSADVAWDECATTDGGHGRIETRRCTVTEDIGWLRERHPDWQKLRSIVQVESTRFDKKYKTQTRETRCYISSLPANAESLLACTRAHWSIENTLHWSLDVTFRDDANRTRKDHATLNLATIRHAAFNLLKHNKSKLSIKKKQLKAALNNNYRTELMNDS